MTDDKIPNLLSALLERIESGEIAITPGQVSFVDIGHIEK